MFTFKVCQYGTKLAPNLKPVHECTVIPQETCNLKFTPPRKEQKPLISEWCQDDSPPVPDQVGAKILPSLPLRHCETHATYGCFCRILPQCKQHS